MRGDWGSVSDPVVIGVNTVLGAVGAGLMSKAVNIISLARFGATNIEMSVARGALGESMLGINPIGKLGISVGGNRFIPDRITSIALDESKNVASISAKDARQIMAEATYSASKGLNMTLWTRSGTDLSRVQGLIDNGALSVRNIPGIGSNGFRVLTNGESAVLGSGLGGSFNGGRAALALK